MSRTKILNSSKCIHFTIIMLLKIAHKTQFLLKLSFKIFCFYTEFISVQLKLYEQELINQLKLNLINKNNFLPQLHYKGKIMLTKLKQKIFPSYLF